MKPCWPCLAWLLCCAAERTHYALDRPNESPAPALGDMVQIEGLTSDAGQLLNGFQGRVVQWDGDRGRFAVQLRGVASWKSLKATNLKPLVQLQRSVLAHQVVQMASGDPCANMPAAVLANRVATVMWILGLRFDRGDDGSNFLRGAAWNKDCQVSGIARPGDVSIGGNFSSLSDLETFRHLETFKDGAVLQALLPLRQINLAGTQIAGNLSILEAAPNLEVLNISSTRVQGTIDVLRYTPRLEVLDVSSTTVDGFLNVLATKSRLRSLNLSESFVYGDVQSLRSPTSRLRHLDLSFSMIYGVLDFSLPQLEDVKLRGAKWIRGNFGHFLRSAHLQRSPLRRLDLTLTRLTGATKQLMRYCPVEYLSLSMCKVESTLSHFRSCSKMRTLDLSHSVTTGSMDTLYHMPALEELDLSSTRVIGFLEPFRSMPNLHSVDLSDTKVDGDVSVFSQTPKLRRLNLRGTASVGRFKARPPLESVELSFLEELDFSDTKVSGDMADFPVMPKLQRMAISSSYVWGDLKVLGNKAQDLRIVEAASTKITGNIDGFKALPRLYEIDVSSTNVTGDIASLSPRLREAMFGRSNVTGDVATLATFKDLQRLSLQHTRVHGDLQAFGPLSGLIELDLASTNVFGNLQVLQKAFEESLVKLDLSSTKITGDIAVCHYPASHNRLRKISLDNTAVFGDIVVFSTLSILESVSLSHTQVWGDVAQFSDNKHVGFKLVKVLSLRSTMVHGTIDSFTTASNLTTLDLANTAVEGEFVSILSCEKLQMVDLSNTSVQGSFNFITRTWPDLRMAKLESLKLSNTNVTLETDYRPTDWISEQAAVTDFTLKGLFPALKTLDLSGSPFNGSVSELLKLVQSSRHLHTLEASDCQLTGELPNLKDWNGGSPLWQSLRKVVLQKNNITTVDAIPPNLIVLDLSSLPQLDLSPEVLKQAIEQGVYLDLQNTTFRSAENARTLLQDGEGRQLLQGSSYIEMSKPAKGYECHKLLNERLRVSPDLFLPDLLCKCLPGWEGHGTHCVQCPENYFNAESNSSCKRCPKDSTSPVASTSPDACSCPLRGQEIFKNGGTLQCGCRPNFALAESSECQECEELNLQCPEPGMAISEAEPKAGYVRMEMNSSKVYLCLSPARCSSPQCSEGFEGPLCVACATGYRSVRGSCKACSKEPSQPFWWLAVVGLIFCIAAGAAYLWSSRATPAAPEVAASNRRWKTLQELGKAQAPVLLQLCQLWAALAALSFVGKRAEDLEQHKSGEDGNSWIATFWELPYVQTLQLSVTAFKDSVALECQYDGTLVRFLGALGAPLLPLLVLAACAVLEVPCPSKGISAALKVLTLLFIGGASSCANLFTCQYVDGADEPLGMHAFRSQMPMLLCQDSSWQAFWADVVAYTSSLFYGMFIPLLLLHLFTRQHFLMQSCRSVAAVTSQEGSSLSISLQSLTADGKLLFQDGSEQLAGRLVAAAAARIAVSHQNQQLKLRMDKDVIYLQDVLSSGSIASMDPDVMPSWIASGEEMKSSSAVRFRTISEMLMERCTLREAESSERTLTGAKEIFHKYASCGYVWMEVFLKLVSVALVGVDTTGFQISVAICLVTAATIALARPYAQPQVTSLHSLCFACLALASIGFYHHFPLLSRFALLLPFLLSAWQLWKPDSAEALSVRLFDELMGKMDQLRNGKQVTLDAELCQFA